MCARIPRVTGTFANHLAQHWGLNFSILFEAIFKTTGSHSVEVYFAKAGAKSLAKAILFEVQIWIGDCILVSVPVNPPCQSHCSPLFAWIDLSALARVPKELHDCPCPSHDLDQPSRCVTCNCGLPALYRPPDTMYGGAATGTVMLYGLSQSSAALLPHVKDLVTACFSLILM